MWLYILLLWIFFLATGFLLAASLPLDISDRRKLQITEFLLRISNMYLGDIIERFFGENARNSVLRFWMNLGFLIPFSPPQGINVHDERMRGIRVRCYSPDRVRSKGAVVFIHGGGWATMKPDYYDTVLFWLVANLGIRTFSIDYRLAPEHPYPAAVDDCLAAVEHLHENCNDYGIDGNKIAMVGDSAGGNLAAVVCQKLKEQKFIICQVLIYPVTSVFSFNLPSYQEYHKLFKGTALLSPKQMATWILMYMGLPAHAENVKKLMRNRHLSKDLRASTKYEKYLDGDHLKKTITPEDEKKVHHDEEKEDPLLAEAFKKAQDPAVSPIFGVTGDLPPAMIITCGYDVLRDEGIIYHRALQDAGVKSDWLHFPRGFHGILNMPRSLLGNNIGTKIANFLEGHMIERV